MVDNIYNINVSCFPKSKFKHYLKPYWDRELTIASKANKAKRWEWLMAGGHNYGDQYVQYKCAKNYFRSHCCTASTGNSP